MNPSRQETITDAQTVTSKQDQTRFANHTIFIPLIIAIYTVIEDQNNLANAEKTRQRDLEIANMTQTTETQIAEANRLNELLIAEQARQKDRELAADQQNQNILVEYQMFIAKLVLELLLSANLITFRKSSDLVIIDGIITLAYMDLNNVNFGLLSYEGEKLERVRTIPLDGLSLKFGYLVNASFRHTSLSCATFIAAILDSADFSFVLCDQPTCFPININQPFLTDFTGAATGWWTRVDSSRVN